MQKIKWQLPTAAKILIERRLKSRTPSQELVSIRHETTELHHLISDKGDFPGWILLIAMSIKGLPGRIAKAKVENTGY
jgi:hypothetical protein